MLLGLKNGGDTITEGICPKCKSKLSYSGEGGVDDDGYDWKSVYCTNCDFDGIELYTLVYKETVL